MNIKIYNFGNIDYYAAKNLREAVREYLNCSGGTIREALQEVSVVSEEDMDRLTFFDDPYDPELSTSKRTFREQLNNLIAAGEKFPTAFASSEW